MHWIALVGPELEENLGIRSISSSLRSAGFATAIIPFNVGNDLGQVMRMIHSAPQPPLMVAISLSFQIRSTECMALVMALRESGYRGHITGGGHFGYFCRHELLADFRELDTVCCGEAEETVIDLARALVEDQPLGAVAGLCRRGDDGSIVDNPARAAPALDALPWPDREGTRASCLGHPIAAIVGGRGCYGSCAFCCIAAWHRSNSRNRPYRMRSTEDIAKEMASLYFEYGIEIFLFHDDNFFLPGSKDNLDRIRNLGEALDRHGVGRIATMVKARPTDINREILAAMKQRLGLFRIFLGVENDSAQGLITLGRGVLQRQNHAAMDALGAAGIYTCFNLLMFEPGATLESIDANLEFMKSYGDNPFFFGRVELYAGTPLLERMQHEGRARGNYMGWDYTLRNPAAQYAFELFMRCFYARNFLPDSPVLALMAAKHDCEICCLFHPEVFRREWLDRANTLCLTLANDTITHMKAILEFAGTKSKGASEDRLVAGLTGKIRQLDSAVMDEASDLQKIIHRAVGKTCCHTRSMPHTLTIVPPMTGRHYRRISPKTPVKRSPLKKEPLYA